MGLTIIFVFSVIFDDVNAALFPLNFISSIFSLLEFETLSLENSQSAFDLGVRLMFIVRNYCFRYSSGKVLVVILFIVEDLNFLQRLESFMLSFALSAVG